ncbi:hypothetical protein EVAR_67180_1 [Eumeta japonica]|uniref:Uncharacterized protein n=1 Tax=Eumeta variegata TaxID=151549 RepID=A0A4C2A344_EUMVA|nr:hypothetical protein EVAR_67180_1 [Eumeta japonica]
MGKCVNHQNVQKADRSINSREVAGFPRFRYADYLGFLSDGREVAEQMKTADPTSTSCACSDTPLTCARGHERAHHETTYDARVSSWTRLDGEGITRYVTISTKLYLL